jgi:hypothetical protein
MQILLKLGVALQILRRHGSNFQYFLTKFYLQYQHYICNITALEFFSYDVSFDSTKFGHMLIMAPAPVAAKLRIAFGSPSSRA